MVQLWIRPNGESMFVFAFIGNYPSLVVVRERTLESIEPSSCFRSDLFGNREHIGEL